MQILIVNSTGILFLELNCLILKDSQNDGLLEIGNKDLHNLHVCKVIGISAGKLQRF
jgi:hypothetical protein